MGSVKGLSLYERQDGAIKGISPDASIEREIQDSWIKLTESLLRSNAIFNDYRVVIDRRATYNGNQYQVFYTVEDGDGKQIDVQISEFTSDQSTLLAKIFQWKSAATNPSTTPTTATAAPSADFTEIKELLKQQAENLNQLAEFVQQDSHDQYRILEETLSKQDKTHAQKMQNMKADYDQQLLDLLQNMRQQHEEFMNSVNITLKQMGQNKPDGQKDEEIRKLRFCIGVLEGVSRYIVPEVRAVHEAMKNMSGVNNGGIAPKIVQDIVAEQSRLLQGHQQLLDSMEVIRNALDNAGVAHENLAKTTRQMAQENATALLKVTNEQAALAHKQQQLLVDNLSALQNEINKMAQENSTALQTVVEELHRFMQTTSEKQKLITQNQVDIVRDQKILRGGLETLTTQFNGLQQSMDRLQQGSDIYTEVLTDLTMQLSKMNAVVVEQGNAQGEITAVLQGLLREQQELKNCLQAFREQLQNSQTNPSTLNAQLVQNLSTLVSELTKRVEMYEQTLTNHLETVSQHFVSTNTFQEVLTQQNQSDAAVLETLRRCEELLKQMQALMQPQVVQRVEPRPVEIRDQETQTESLYRPDNEISERKVDEGFRAKRAADERLLNSLLKPRFSVTKNRNNAAITILTDKATNDRIAEHFSFDRIQNQTKKRETLKLYRNYLNLLLQRKTLESQMPKPGTKGNDEEALQVLLKQCKALDEDIPRAKTTADAYRDNSN